MERIITTIDLQIVGIIVFLLFLICIFGSLLFLIWKTKNQIATLSEGAGNKLKNTLLVNLSVRHNFIKFLNKILPEAINRKEKLALLFLDLDNLKGINDSLGINIGDLLLEQVANRINTEVKANSHMVTHLGGGEFVILLGFYNENLKSIINTTERLINTINNNFRIANYDVLITASIGICIFPDDTEVTENLLQYADMARYNAKQNGRNTYCFYNESINRKTLEQTLMYADLRKALEKNELILYYQPKIRTADHAIVGAEALIRWRHPTKGLVLPNIFIPLAEDTGMIIAMGDWILRTTCTALKQLQAINITDFTISVNISPHQFNNSDIAGKIAAILWDTGINPTLLELELTESLVMQNIEKSFLMLRVLKTMGFKIAIDDFGIGQSSLSHLNNFPVDTLKIDQSFIKNMHLKTDNFNIVITILSMAKQLGLEVVAEGVEYKEQADLLIKEKCDYIQGYFYSPPVPFEKLIELIKRGNYLL